MGIVVIGSVFMDIKGYPDAQYIPAGRNAGRVVHVHGGVSRNLVEDIANVELRPTFIGLADETVLGTDVIEKLNRHKVDTHYMRRVEDGMGTWLAVFDNHGDVVASISRRPDLMEILHILEDEGDEIFRNADSIVIEADIEIPILKKVLDLADTWNKKVFGLVSNMSIALERRDLISRMSCFVCNQQEAGLLFFEDYAELEPEEMAEVLSQNIKNAQIPCMIVTMGEKGAVYADMDGTIGVCPASKVDVLDTTGCGDAFCAGVAIGLTYGKSLPEACEIGTRLASSVVATKESVCPRFRPEEFGLSSVD